MAMRAPNCFLFLVLASLIACYTAQEAMILVAPEPVNAILNTTAVFHCVAIGRLFSWFIDGHGPNTLQAMERGVGVTDNAENGTTNSTLTIPATMDNDNIAISCEVGGNGFDSSPEVLLRVQGLLDSVPNLAIVRTDDYNHILMWNPPFTLDITDVNPDIIAYTVCDNVTRSCQNTSDTRYGFCTLCDPVEITVSAWNPVGEGERTSIVHEPQDDVRRSTAVTSLESEVSFKSLSEPVVTLLLQVDGNCFNLLNTELKGEYSGVTEFEMMPTVVGTGTATLTMSENIMADDFYTVTITVIQEPDTGEMSGFQQITRETNLTTFDVQEVDVRSGDRTIVVTCAFATGSQAQGCFIVIQLVSDSPPYPPIMEAEARRGVLANGDLEGNASTSFTDLEADTYNVLIYDVGVDGTFDLDKSLYNELIEIFSPSIGPVQTRTSTITVTSPAPSGSIPTPSSVDDAIPIYYYVVSIIVVVVLVVVVVVLVFIVYRRCKEQGRKYFVHLIEMRQDSVPSPYTHRTVLADRGDESPLQNQILELAEPPSPPSFAGHFLPTELWPSGSPTTGGVIQCVEVKSPQGQNEGHYSEIAPLSSGATTTQPQTDVNVQYAEVKGTMNPKGLVYAHLGARPSDAPPIPPSQEEKLHYSQIRPHTKGEGDKKRVAPSQPLPPIPVAIVTDQLPTFDNLTKLLKPVASKWHPLGEHLGVSDNLLDEVFTNMDTDHDCMVEMLDWRLKQVKPPTWKEVAEALHQLGERQLAEIVAEIHETGILPGMVEMPVKFSEKNKTLPPPIPPRDETTPPPPLPPRNETTPSPPPRNETTPSPPPREETTPSPPPPRDETTPSPPPPRDETTPSPPQRDETTPPPPLPRVETPPPLTPPLGDETPPPLRDESPLSPIPVMNEIRPPPTMRGGMSHDPIQQTVHPQEESGKETATSLVIAQPVAAPSVLENADYSFPSEGWKSSKPESGSVSDGSVLVTGTQTWSYITEDDFQRSKYAIEETETEVPVIPSFVSSAGDVSAPHLGPGREPSVLPYTEIVCQPKQQELCTGTVRLFPSSTVLPLDLMYQYHTEKKIRQLKMIDESSMVLQDQTSPLTSEIYPQEERILLCITKKGEIYSFTLPQTNETSPSLVTEKNPQTNETSPPLVTEKNPQKDKTSPPLIMEKNPQKDKTSPPLIAEKNEMSGSLMHGPPESPDWKCMRYYAWWHFSPLPP